MQFRDPRQLRPVYDPELDTAVRAAADLIATTVARFGHRRSPDDPGRWNSFAEQRAIDLVDAAIAKRRDDIDCAGHLTVAEREYDVALDRLRRNIEQLMRTAVQVAQERGDDPFLVVDEQRQLVIKEAGFLRTWISAEIPPDDDYV